MVFFYLGTYYYYMFRCLLCMLFSGIQCYFREKWLHNAHESVMFYGSQIYVNPFTDGTAFGSATRLPFCVKAQNDLQESCSSVDLFVA